MRPDVDAARRVLRALMWAHVALCVASLVALGVGALVARYLAAPALPVPAKDTPPAPPANSSADLGEEPTA